MGEGGWGGGGGWRLEITGGGATSQTNRIKETLSLYNNFSCGYFFFLFFFYCSLGCLSMIAWTHAVLGVLYACVLYFCICICSAQLSMFHMERHSRNTPITTVIINIPPAQAFQHATDKHLFP